MFTIDAVDVNDAYPKVIGLLNKYGVEESSRNGRVLVLPTPLSVTYHNPCDRVLFNKARDANPIFHALESVWMLAGRNDADYVSRIVPGMMNYAESDGHFHGAYGYRWRKHFGHDQLERIIALLREDPTTRRAVLAMWDGAVDQNNGLKDLPCNTQIMFGIREGRLNMMVTNRSNDLVWGMLGANVFHMSFLQEYVAAAVGVPIGVYTQCSFNAHGYIDNPKWDHWMSDTTEHLDRVFRRAQPICSNPSTFLEECEAFCENPYGDFKNKWLTETASPLMTAWGIWKNLGKNHVDTHKAIERIACPQLRIATQEWIDRRAK